MTKSIFRKFVTIITYFYMDFKEEIKSVLKKLKTLGFDRRTLEKELKYSPLTIDQTLSRGGNEKMLASLQGFLELAESKKQPLARTPEEQTQSATVKMLVNEVAKLKAKVSGVSFEDVLIELHQNTIAILKDMQKGG